MHWGKHPAINAVCLLLDISLPLQTDGTGGRSVTPKQQHLGLPQNHPCRVNTLILHCSEAVRDAASSNLCSLPPHAPSNAPVPAADVLQRGRWQSRLSCSSPRSGNSTSGAAAGL